MSDIPEGRSGLRSAAPEELIRIANGRRVLCLLCVSILETIRRIKAPQLEGGMGPRRGGPLRLAPRALQAPQSPDPSSLLHAFIARRGLQSLVRDLKCADAAVRRPQTRGEPLNFPHSIICIGGAAPDPQAALTQLRNIKLAL